MLATCLYLNDYHIPSLKQTGKKPYILELFMPLLYCSTLCLWLQVSSAHTTELSQMRTWVPCTCICANIKRTWIYKNYVIFYKVTWVMVQALATLNFVLHKVYKIATMLTCFWRIQTQVFFCQPVFVYSPQSFPSFIAQVFHFIIYNLSSLDSTSDGHSGFCLSVIHQLPEVDNYCNW